MQNTDVKSSLLRIRELREKLCTDRKEHQEAYNIKDFVVSQLQELHEMICDRKVRRKKLENKSSYILENISALPDCNDDGDI